MNTLCTDFIRFISENAPKHDKQKVEEAACRKFNLIKDRKVYHNESFAVRFSYSKSSGPAFSNTVLSLSALEKYDTIPFFVVLVRRDANNLILLANSTFLKKISHSSQKLSLTNIAGSFNGSDILRDYNNISNQPENFSQLFALHEGFEWNDNLERLVEATSRIQPTVQKFVPTQEELQQIFKSVGRAEKFLSSPDFSILAHELNQRCRQCENEILVASHIENTNIRGRLIESLITSDGETRKRLIDNLANIEKALPAYDTKNGLGDYIVHFENEDTYTDIKTKIVYLNANPKAYHIDKFLKQMANERSVFLFFFIGIDRTSVFRTLLCSVYHPILIDNTLLQHHWAGRSTRGVAQFSGKAVNEMLNAENFVQQINSEKCNAFLKQLLNR